MKISEKDYSRAVKNALSDKDRSVLKALYEFPNSTATAEELQEKLGDSDKIVTNRKIGLIGKKIAKYLNKIPEPYMEGRPAWFSVIGPYGPNDGKVRTTGLGWEMHENLRNVFKKRHFLQYVAFDNWDDTGFIEFTGTNVNRHIREDDFIWIVSKDAQEKLVLFGRVIVGNIEKAAKSKNKFSIKYYSKQPMQKICTDINSVAEKLTFIIKAKNSTPKSIIMEDKSVNFKLFEMIRQIDLQSANILSGFLVENNKPENGGGFGSLENNKIIEDKAIKFVTTHYQKKGWTVLSVENKKIGFDLLCTRGKITEHVEVKGISGSGSDFIMTRKELETAGKDKSFKLCIVNILSGENRQMKKYDQDEFLKSFTEKPISYWMRLKERNQ